ncbi:MAG: hypothetical protein FOGNACKC_01807 [Anaerolineae bacterium]|nr:hypothetical protein [Anaerolineae bacterium]
MNFLWDAIIGYFLFSFLLINGWCLAVKVLPARCPIWWKKHIVAPDPTEQWPL